MVDSVMATMIIEQRCTYLRRHKHAWMAQHPGMTFSNVLVKTHRSTLADPELLPLDIWLKLLAFTADMGRELAAASSLNNAPPLSTLGGFLRLHLLGGSRIGEIERRIDGELLHDDLWLHLTASLPGVGTKSDTVVVIINQFLGELLKE